MDTPYRLKTLMEDIVKILGANIPCVLAFELTKEKEKFYRGNAGNILNHVEKEIKRGVCVDGKIKLKLFLNQEKFFFCFILKSLKLKV